ncbi:MAG: sensor histidine kinase [Pedobacter sp.]|nr:MAG: sensor histidine kinase [Pedobacter sp.]
MREAGYKYSYIANFLIPELFRYSILYFSFLLLNFCIAPSIHKATLRSIFVPITVGLFLGIGLTTSILNTYSKAYQFNDFETIQAAYDHFFLKGFTYAAWLVSMIIIYVTIKKLIIYFLENEDTLNDPSNRLKLEAVLGGAVWFVGLLLLIATSAHLEVMVCWTLVICASIFIVLYSIHYLIPQIKKQQKTYKHYFGRIFIIIIIACIPLSLTTMLFSTHDELIAAVIGFHVFTQIIICSPLSWYLYKKRTESTNELTSLKTELGKSDASLSFLRSQINPHFLFNALNTLYGTALQENAERTGEGIQKLGDMMRFMLQENMQDKISLTRDVDYLNNYISLQKLRISRSPSITVEAQIDDQLNNHQIAPMLLIPFVENAFKHGISLQQPSHIRITLQTKENVLYFDVHNSIHLKADNDPEKLKSGIGLENVKQRLTHLYKNRHELIIRESAKEFFIHLTLQLEGNS